MADKTQSSASEDVHDDPQEPSEALSSSTKPKEATGIKYPTAPIDARSSLETYDWTAFEQDYSANMQAFAEEECQAFANFDTWTKVFEAWVATTTTHENERAAKRLKTRMTHVQLSEERVERRRQHYVKVVEAFRGALEMLE